MSPEAPGVALTVISQHRFDPGLGGAGRAGRRRGARDAGRAGGLRLSGYASLEPHLAEAGRYGGFSGPQEFRRAAAALKGLLRELSIPGQEQKFGCPLNT